MTTPTTIDRKQLRTAALTAAGWPAGSSGQHQLLTRQLERLRATIDSGLKILAERSDPDLTLFMEGVARQVTEATTTAIQLDTVATIERNLEQTP